MRALAAFESSHTSSIPAACHTRSRPCIPGLNGLKSTARQRQPAATQPTSQRSDRLVCSAGYGPHGASSGYTPASYITYSEDEKHFCYHEAKVEVDAPVSICFGLWDDWHRLVDYMDLVAQIGLDPNEPDMGLFQCFYRWGKMPVMEIVFLARKEDVVPNKVICFSTVWGMPMAGHVHFEELGPSRTRVTLSFDHALPRLLVDMRVGKFGVETHMAGILKDNMSAFKKLAESLHSSPSSAPARQEAVQKPHMKPDEMTPQEVQELQQQRREMQEAMDREVPGSSSAAAAEEEEEDADRAAMLEQAAAAAAAKSAQQQAAAPQKRGKGAAAAPAAAVAAAKRGAKKAGGGSSLEQLAAASTRARRGAAKQ